MFGVALERLNGPVSAHDLAQVIEDLRGGLPEFQVGRALTRSGHVTAIIDANDCVGLALADLARASDVRIRIEQVLIEGALGRSLSPIELARVLGPPSGDLALVFTFPLSYRDALELLLASCDRELLVIGRCVRGSSGVAVDELGLEDVVDVNRTWFPGAGFQYPPLTEPAQV